MKILHFADLHLGVENYGHIDPATGLSTRLLDFLKALDELVDYAVDNKVDLVLFCGDAYKSREPTQTQQREFAKRIRRLSTAGIPTFLLIGNHDLPGAIGRATSTEIFDTLAVDKVYVSNRPDLHLIPTDSGILQIVSLPWPRRNALLNREENKNLTPDQLNEKLLQTLTAIISENISKLDKSLPAILAGHIWVFGARTGTEASMTIGQEPMLLPTAISHPALDYVALGHIHRHQVISENPSVVYAGSLERLDFGDEDDGKGFYEVDIQNDQTGKRQVSYRFHEVSARRFATINVNIESQDAEPTATILKVLSEQQDRIEDAIVRLNLSLPAESSGHIRENDLREALKTAHIFSITREVRSEKRLRLGGVSAEGLTPLDALKKWLETQKYSPEQAKTLLEYGEKLIQSRETGNG